MVVESPDTDAAPVLADLWVDMAAEQRQHGSHLAADANRGAMADSIRRAIIADGVRVARAEADDAAETGTVLGFVMFTTGTTVLETAVSRGSIENLYVVPDARNDGLGGALLDAAAAALAERGIDRVALEVMADNEAARRFYRRHGFEPHRVTMERPVESDTHSKGGE